MSFLNGNNFTDRQAAAAKARKAMAEKFLANSKHDPADPAVIGTIFRLARSFGITPLLTALRRAFSPA